MTAEVSVEARCSWDPVDGNRAWPSRFGALALATHWCQGRHVPTEYKLAAACNGLHPEPSRRGPRKHRDNDCGGIHRGFRMGMVVKPGAFDAPALRGSGPGGRRRMSGSPLPPTAWLRRAHGAGSGTMYGPGAGRDLRLRDIRRALGASHPPNCASSNKFFNYGSSTSFCWRISSMRRAVQVPCGNPDIENRAVLPDDKKGTLFLLVRAGRCRP
jgi:hypothetical protein